MNELWETGYMHNRTRMITASFLTKNLLIPWQEGEKWLKAATADMKKRTKKIRKGRKKKYTKKTKYTKKRKYTKKGGNKIPKKRKYTKKRKYAKKRKYTKKRNIKK